MGVDITFNKWISFKEVEEKTNLKKHILDDGRTVLKNDEGQGVWCSAEEGDTEFDTIFSFRSQEIMDELVRVFNVKFITDNEWQEIIGENYTVIPDSMWDITTTSFGYFVDGDTVKVPIRDIKNRIKPNTDASYDSNYDDLPF